MPGVVIAADKVQAQGEARAGRQLWHGVAAANRQAVGPDLVTLAPAALQYGFHVPVQWAAAAEKAGADAVADLATDALEEILEVADSLPQEEVLLGRIAHIVHVNTRARQKVQHGGGVHAPNHLVVERLIVEDIKPVFNVQGIERVDLPAAEPDDAA